MTQTLPSANNQSGTSTDGYSFHYGISGNGGQYTLSVSSYGEAWLYEVDTNHPSTWIVRDDTAAGSDDVQFGSSGYARIGTGWIWVDKPNATKVLVPKKNGEIHQVDIVNKKTTLVSFTVTADWVKQHIRSLFSDLATLAQSKGLQSLSVNWTDDQGSQSGTYSLGSDFLVSSSWDGIIRHCKPTDGQWQSSKYVMAGFSDAAFTKRNDTKTLDDMVATAGRLGFGNEFDVYGMPLPSWLGGPTCVCGHYSSKGGTLTGVDKDGLMFQMKPNDARPSLLGFGPTWFAARSGNSMLAVVQEMEAMANKEGRGIRECYVYGMPGQASPGKGQANQEENALSGLANFSTKTIDAATSKGESFEGSWQNGYRMTFRGFNADFFKDVGGGFEYKLQHAVSEAKANASKYGSSSFDMCAPFDALPNTISGHYDAGTSTFTGTDNDGRFYKSVSGSNLQFVGFGLDYFKKNPGFSLGQLSDYAKGRGANSVSVSGMHIKDGKTLNGTWNRDSGWIFQDADGLLWKCEDSWKNGDKLTLRGFNIDFFKDVGGGFERKLQRAVDIATANDPRYVTPSFDMYAPFDALPNTISGHYDANTSTFIGADNDGLLHKCVSGSKLQFAGFGLDYFKKNPSFSLEQLSDYARGRGGVNSTTVSGMPTKDGKTLDGTWNRDSGWMFQDAEGLLWKCEDSLSKLRFYGFGQQYLKTHGSHETYMPPDQPTVAELAAKAIECGTTEWIVAGYHMPDNRPAITGTYTRDAGATTGRIIGTTDDGLIYARWGREAYKLLGVNGEWLQRNQASVMKPLEEVAQREKADMLTIMDATDTKGSAVAALFDYANKRFIIGKSTSTGQMELLTIVGKMAWFRQAGQPGLLFAETMPGDPAATMKHIADIAPTARQVFTELGVLESVEMLDATTISAYSKQLGLTVSFNLTASGRYRLVNFMSDKALDAAVQRGIAGKYDCDDAVYAGFGPDSKEYVWLHMKSDLQSRQTQRSKGDKLKYVGVNEKAREFYIFNAGSGLQCTRPDSDITLKASGVVRYGNVVGIWGVNENQLNYLPAMDGVDAYAAITGNGELTFRVSNDKVKLLSVGSKWVANHAGESGALDQLLSRYEHPKEVIIWNDKGSVAYNTETKQHTPLPKAAPATRALRRP